MAAQLKTVGPGALATPRTDLDLDPGKRKEVVGNMMPRHDRRADTPHHHGGANVASDLHELFTERFGEPASVEARRRPRPRPKDTRSLGGPDTWHNIVGRRWALLDALEGGRGRRKAAA